VYSFIEASAARADGDSALEIRCRCLLRGMWPVRNWMSRLACFLGSDMTSFLNFVEGRVGSMRLIHVYRGDVCHTLLCCQTPRP